MERLCPVCKIRQVGISRFGKPFSRCFECRGISLPDEHICPVGGCLTACKKKYIACWIHRDNILKTYCPDCGQTLLRVPWKSYEYISKPEGPDMMCVQPCTGCWYSRKNPAPYADEIAKALSGN